MHVLARFLLMARPKCERTKICTKRKLTKNDIPTDHPLESHFNDAILAINKIATILTEEDELS